MVLFVGVTVNGNPPQAKVVMAEIIARGFTVMVIAKAVPEQEPEVGVTE